MKFHYSARGKTGDMQVGFVEAASKAGAFNILNSHDLFILSIEEVRQHTFISAFIDFFNRVKKVDIAIFTRQFATMLEAKIPINDALKNLYAQTKNIFLKEAIFEINTDIDAGLSISQSLERHPNIFSDFYTNLIKSAEVTGRVEEVMGFLADFLEKELGLVSRVRNALIYPVVVLGLFFVVAGILVGFVFPQLAPIFEESSVDVPAITSMLLSSGTFIAKWWLAILIILIIAYVIIFDYFKSAEGKAVAAQISLRLPVIGTLFRRLYVTRFSESVGVLIRGGIPIAQAIEISGQAIGNPVYQEKLHEVADNIRRGELLSVALSRSPEHFPAMVGQMVAVGEQTGKLEAMFDRVAHFYTREIDATVNNLVELIQPTLMIVLGSLVGLLFAAILIPIYNLAQAF